MARPPKAPTYLDEIATAEWKARAKQLMERGDLIDADWRNLELYCLNYSMYRRAWQTLRRGVFRLKVLAVRPPRTLR